MVPPALCRPTPCLPRVDSSGPVLAVADEGRQLVAQGVEVFDVVAGDAIVGDGSGQRVCDEEVPVS